MDLGDAETPRARNSSHRHSCQSGSLQVPSAGKIDGFMDEIMKDWNVEIPREKAESFLKEKAVGE